MVSSSRVGLRHNFLKLISCTAAIATVYIGYDRQWNLKIRGTLVRIPPEAIYSTSAFLCGLFLRDAFWSALDGSLLSTLR